MNVTENQDLLDFTCSGTQIKIGITTGYKINYATNIAVHALTSVSAIILNGLLLIVFIRYRRLHTPANMLLLSNTVTDIIWALTYIFCIIPFLSMSAFRMQHSCVFYLMNVLFGYTCATVSILSINLLAADRYLAIYKPFVYVERITDNSVLYFKVIVLVWIVTICFTVLSLATGFLLLMVLGMINMVVSTSWPVFVFVNIFKTVRRLNVNVPQVGNAPKEQKDRNKEFKIAKTTGMMTLALFLCYMPQSLLMVLWLYDPAMFNAQVYALYFWSLAILSLKWFVNPLMFCLTMKDIRSSVAHFLGISREESQSDITSSSTHQVRPKIHPVPDSEPQ